ncbi:MAG: hypothetical protein HRT68_16015 [Flavobacteriaceae bacterium]|nr:hypothetical protein [Flavobacteriaceae bacterium]
MKYVYLTLSWVFGVLFGLMGLVFIIASPLGGLCLIFISLLLLPPVRNAVYSKTNEELSFKVRVISIFVLVIAFSVFISEYQDKKDAELTAKSHQKNMDYFNSHRDEIISSVSAALAENNFQIVITQSSKFLAVNDAELNQLHNQAQDELDGIMKAEKKARESDQREQKKKEILAKLKTVPASKFKENKDLYQQLTKLNPDNSFYQKKLEHYSKKLNSKLEKELKEQESLIKEREIRIAKFGEAPVQSAWDGSYYAVERYLKIIANDPDSIEVDDCTKVYHIESGWLVGCEYRGRNAFGGMTRQSNWFSIVHDQVVQMHHASAYRP